MGTNYDYFPPGAKPTEDEDGLHIGKQSAGWPFMLQVYTRGEGPANEAEWRALLADPNAIVRDEYGQYVSPSDVIARMDRHPLIEEPRGFS